MPANDIGAIYTPSIYGRTSFPLRHKGEPIFNKTFDGSNPAIVGISSNKIEVSNHFFKTGESLQYNTGTGTSVGISTLSPGWSSGIGTVLPKVVYPIVIDSNNSQNYSNSNIQDLERPETCIIKTLEAKNPRLEKNGVWKKTSTEEIFVGRNAGKISGNKGQVSYRNNKQEFG